MWNIALRPWIWAPASLENSNKAQGKGSRAPGAEQSPCPSKVPPCTPLSLVCPQGWSRGMPTPHPQPWPARGSLLLLGKAGSRAGCWRQISTPSSLCFSKNGKCVSPTARHISIQISISHSVRYLPSCIYFPITKLSSAF